MDKINQTLPPFENQPDAGLPDDSVARRHVDWFKKIYEDIRAAKRETKLLYLMLGLLGVYSVIQQGKISSLEKDKSNMTKELEKEKNKSVWKKIFEGVASRFPGTSVAASN